jgi:hypothetical protein
MREELSPREIGARWFGILGPLAAVWIQQQLAYYLVPKACYSGNVFIPHVAPLVGIAITAYAGLISWREVDSRRSRRSNGEDRVAGSAWFFGAVGLLMTGLAAALILAQWLPDFFINPCTR